MRTPDRITLPKRMAFACPELTVTLAFATTNSWYLFFLIEAVGLAPAAAGVAFVVGRIVDGLLDPLIGRMSDEFTARKGRKFFPKLGIIPAVICFIAMWQIPGIVSPGWPAFLVATISFSLFSLFYTMISVPRLAMLPGFDPSSKGRTVQVAIDFVLVFACVFAATSLIPLAIRNIWSVQQMSAAPLSAWAAITSGVGCVMIAAYLVFLIVIPDQGVTKFTQTRESRRLNVLEALKNSRFQNTIGAFIFSVITLISMQATLPFLLEKSLLLTTGEQAMALGIVFGTTLISFPMWVWLSKHFEKQICLMIGCLPYAAFLALVPTLIPGAGLTTQVMIAGSLCGLGLAALSIFPWSMMPDAVSDLSRLSSEPVQSFATSLFTFANKAAGALGVLGVSLVLGSGDPSVGEEEGPITAWVLIIIPSIALTFTFLFALRSNLIVEKETENELTANMES